MACKLRTAPGKALDVYLTLDPQRHLVLFDSVEALKEKYPPLRFNVVMARQILKVSKLSRATGVINIKKHKSFFRASANCRISLVACIPYAHASLLKSFALKCPD